MHVGHVYSTQLGILQFCLSLYLLLLQSLRISCESLGPSQVFPDLAQMSLYARELHDSSEYGGAFKASS